MNLTDCIDSFLSYLLRMGYSQKTIDAYEFDIHKFVDFVESNLKTSAEEIRIDDINRGVIVLWSNYCLKKGISHRTFSRKIATIKSFFKYLIRENITQNNPAELINLPKIPKTAPKSLSQDEIRQLIDAPAPDKPNYLRNRAILLLLYSTGLRVSEIVSLKVQQIILDQQAILIKGKGAKERILPLTGSTYSALIEYFAWRETELPETMTGKAPAFITPKGKSLTVRMIQYMVEKYGLDAGIMTHIHPHLIRHSIATHLIEEGCNVESVRQTLGHEDLATTSIYLKTSQKYLRQEHKKFNPTDRLAGG